MLIAVAISAFFVLTVVVALLRRRKALALAAAMQINMPENNACDIPPPPVPAQLISTDQSIFNKPIPLIKSITAIGREAGNDIVIPKETISAFHARIEYQSGSFFLEDQRSSNGTKLNSLPVEPYKAIRLKSGDCITFDIYTFQFVFPEQGAAVATVINKAVVDSSEDLTSPLRRSVKASGSGGRAEPFREGTGSEVLLAVIEGPDAGKSFVFSEPRMYMGGRAPDADIHFSDADPYISRRHFLLEIAPPNVYFHDLDEATNSSTINDREIPSARLAAGDIIGVGSTKLRISFSFEQSVKKSRCSLCGTDFSIDADETADQFCQVCIRLTEAETVHAPRIANKQVPMSIRCSCGRDITDRANSDGRARELNNTVLYCCEDCLPPCGQDSGKKIDAYEIIRKLGEGGMGKVYLAWHRPTCRLVAVKEMNIADRHCAPRFAREIRVMKQIVHGNVVRYIDNACDAQTGKPYMVMEYIQQGSLGSLLRKNGGTLPQDLSVRLIIDFLEGLEHIHRLGIVHRDIKPDNILVQKSNSGAVIPKITDFGLAREFEKLGGSSLTRANTALGTIFYMPQEQIRDARSVREPADLYASGVTLYRMLSGRYPFDFPTEEEVERFVQENPEHAKSPSAALRVLMERRNIKNPLLIILEQEPVPLRSIMPDIPAELADIVDRAIEKDPLRRFQSASEMKSRLRVFNNNTN